MSFPSNDILALSKQAALLDDEATYHPSLDIFSQLMKVVSFNLGMGLPLLYGGWHCQYHKCLDANVYRVPSLYGLIGYISLTMLCHDVLFYHAHRWTLSSCDMSTAYFGTLVD